MSRFRPCSALILPMMILLGCNSAAPFKMFAKTESESKELLSENASQTDQPQADPAIPNIDLGTPATTDFASTPGMSRRLSDSPQPAAGTLSNLADNAEEQPPAVQTSTNPIQLASASRKPLDVLRFAIPGSSKAMENTLAKEISTFERFDFAFKLPTVAGEVVDSRQFHGQLMVVDIWATWCGPCKKAIPEFIAIQEEFQSQGIQVIGITCDSADPEDAPEVARLAYAIGQQAGVNYPLLVDDGTTAKQIPGFGKYPTTLFMTPDGVVRYMVTGAQSKEKLKLMINTILQG